MSGDESDNEPIDPIRAVLMASGAPDLDPEPSEPLMCVKRPDFDQWLPPRRALHLLTAHFETDETISAILNRLSLGLLMGAAELTVWRSGGLEERAELIVVPRPYWRSSYSFDTKSQFWKTGDVTMYGPSGAGYNISSNDYVAFTGVRFDPEGLASLATAMGHDVPALASRSSAPINEHSAPIRAKDIAKDDAERISRAILAGWPETTEALAHKRALAFFPENKVPRDWFLAIFRLIRGNKNPGKLPKIRQ